jgi:hypothetical protein
VKSTALGALTSITKEKFKTHKEWEDWWKNNKGKFKSIEE